MKKSIILSAKIFVAILAVDIMAVPMMDLVIDRSSPDAPQALVVFINIVDDLSSTAHDFVNNLVEGMSAAEFINYAVIFTVIIFVLICIFDKEKRKIKAVVLEEPK